MYFKSRAWRGVDVECTNIYIYIYIYGVVIIILCMHLNPKGMVDCTMNRLFILKV
jgi:hypothetical protein